MRQEPQSIAVGWVRVDPSDGASLDRIAILSAADRERAGRFRRVEDRHRFVAGRAVLTALLRQAGEPARGPLELALTRNGRPFLAHAPGLAFSISHAGGLVGVALTRGARVGLDIEALDRQVDLAAVAGRIFNSTDLARFQALPETDQPGAFFRAWTGKEAVLKAQGVGLFGGLQPIAAPLDERAATLADGRETWHLRPLTLPAGHVGCVACDDPGRELRPQEIRIGELF